MKKVLVIGCGNTLRADDGVGWCAARRIAATMVPGEVTVLARHQLTPDLAEPIDAAGRVIFVDASIQDPPGTIRSRPLFPASAAPAMPTHGLPPSSLLALAKQLYGHCPPAVLVTIGVRNFCFGEAFSAEVSRRLPDLMGRIDHLIRCGFPL